MIEIKKVFFSNKQEIEKCFKIRKEVFVKEQKCDPKDEYENEEESTHFLLLDNNEPVATSRYRKTQFGIKMERFAVLGSKRKKGYITCINEATIIEDIVIPVLIAINDF